MTSGPDMQSISSLWQALLGRAAWGVGRGHGSFLHLEFGEPHLVVREPVVPRSATSAKAQRVLLRRGVHIEGDWTLWIEYGDWRLRTAHGELDSETSPGTPDDECLRDLDGQRLVSAEPGTRANGTTFKFDLGAVLEVWPSGELADDQWTLKTRGGASATLQHDGSLRVDAQGSR